MRDLLPPLLQPSTCEEIRLSTGRTLAVGTATPPFDLWQGPPVPNYGGKPVFRRKGLPMFPELAIIDLLAEVGWEGVWVDTFGRKFRNGLPTTHPPAELPRERAALFENIRQACGSTGGCWDVFAWRGDNTAFVESKFGRDRIRRSQITWLESAIDFGIPAESFLIVHWAAPGEPISAAKSQR